MLYSLSIHAFTSYAEVCFPLTEYDSDPAVGMKTEKRAGGGGIAVRGRRLKLIEWWGDQLDVLRTI